MMYIQSWQLENWAAVPFIHFRKRSESADVTMGHAEGMVNGFARCQA
jgi:hypothetical protein